MPAGWVSRARLRVQQAQDADAVFVGDKRDPVAAGRDVKVLHAPPQVGRQRRVLPVARSSETSRANSCVFVGDDV